MTQYWVALINKGVVMGVVVGVATVFEIFYFKIFNFFFFGGGPRGGGGGGARNKALGLGLDPCSPSSIAGHGHRCDLLQ